VFALSLLAFLAGGPARGQGSAADYERSARLFARTRNKVFRDRVQPSWTEWGRHFWYRNDLADGAREWVLVDAAVGKRESAFDHARLAEALSKATGAKVEAARLPLTRLSFVENAAVARFRALGKTWRYDRRTNELRPAAPAKGAAAAPAAPARPPRGGTVSPDGRRRAFFRDHNLHVRDLETGKETPLSREGKAGDGYGGPVWWSPDSKWVVALRIRAGDEPRAHVIESSPRGGVRPRLHSFPYPRPGDVIPLRKPHLFDVGAGTEVPVSDELFPNPWSITGVRWESDSSRFTFVYNQRGHQVLRVIAVDVKGHARALVNETSKTFIDYAHKQYLHWLEGSAELLWMSERDGWNHLYLYDARSGKVKNQVTKGEWVVRGVDRVDAAARQVWFRAGGVRPGQDPYQIHFCRVNLDGTGLVVLTEGDGTHAVTWSPDRKVFLDTWSRVDRAPVTELRRSSDGKLLCRLEEADTSALLATGWKAPERFVAKGRDGKTAIHGVLFRPTNFDPAKKYPVVEQIYAGPQGSFVPRSFRAFYGPMALAELGFIVVQIDGMGTSHRSKPFHDVCWRNLADAGLPDRVLWIRAAARKYPCMDLTRVGIYGGSAGGQSAVRALLAHGDFYTVAVADCGCHDNRVDKIWWNELWMGWPVGPHYAEQANATNAHKLQGKLLLIVGELDRNVDPASTMQVVAALVKADKDFDLLVIPGVGHGAAETPYGRRRRKDFLVRHLLGVEPRRAARP
jgi:dipeptidyl aminopeptidase/acylaminoacyl peptidase